MNGTILKASAGTGKTYRLSLEYISSLLSGENFKDILVMTFTKKATSEIKERVLSFLWELHNDKNSELYDNLKKIYPDLNISKENVSKIYYEILNNKDRLNISTIDSFINTIFKNVIAPYLNIFNYVIIDNNENTEHLFKCFEIIVQNKNIFNFFKTFFKYKTERNIENYIDVIKNLINNRWKIILINQTKNQIKKSKYTEISSLFNIIQQIFNIFDIIKEKKNNDDIKKYINKPLKDLVDLDESDYMNFFDKYWKDIIKSEKCWNGNSVKTTKTMDLTNEINELKKHFEIFKIEISKYIFNKEVLPLEKEIFLFINELYEIYDKIKLSTKKFTHLDISNYVFQYLHKNEINLIKNNKITDYFKDIFESNFSTIFIDEFQDTSILQWKILKPIINSSLKTICVGDEKQSIYGWRGGEKTLFENLSNIVNLNEETMNISYRSKKNILNFTNFVFNNISQEYKIKNPKNRWNFSTVQGNSEKEGYVQIIKDYNDASALDNLVQSLKDNFKNSYNGIGIIARSNKQLDLIANALNNAKIPFVIESNDLIFNHRAIAPIYKLLNLFVNKNIFNLLEFLRCDIIKIGNTEVKTILQNQELVINYLFHNKESLNYEPIKSLKEIFDKLKEIFDKGFTNNNFVLNSITQFNITKYFNGGADLKNIFEFLKISKNYKNILDFYNYLSDKNNFDRLKQVSLEEKNIITLLTIHKSKGLEFETIYYYHQTSKNINNRGIELYMELTSPFEDISNYIFIEQKYKKILEYLNDDYLFLKNLEEKNIQEEINNMYVALTRAKNNLIIILDNKIDNYLKNSIEKLDVLKKGCIYKNNQNFKITEQHIQEKNFLNKINFIEKDDDLCNNLEWEHSINLIIEEKRQIGNAIHYYLEFILYNTELEHTEAYNRTFSKFGAIIGKTKLKSILTSCSFREFFSKNTVVFSNNWDIIYPEYEVYYKGELKRIDRLMIKKPSENKKGTILIIDYKTGEINQKQLDEYVDIIKSYLTQLNQLEFYNILSDFLEINI